MQFYVNRKEEYQRVKEDLVDRLAKYGTIELRATELAIEREILLAEELVDEGILCMMEVMQDI